MKDALDMPIADHMFIPVQPDGSMGIGWLVTRADAERFLQEGTIPQRPTGIIGGQFAPLSEGGGDDHSLGPVLGPKPAL